MRKKWFKKAAAVVLIAGLLCMNLIGCGSGTTDQTTTDENGTEAVTSSPANTITEVETDAETDAETIETDQSDKDGEEINIVIGDQAKYFTFKVAEKLGLFEEEFAGENITVSVENFVDGTSELEAFSAGALDFAIIGDQPAVSAIANGSPLTIIGTYCSCSEGYALCAAEDSGIESVADLKGKNVAATSGTALHQLLLLMLEAEGMSIDDIEYYSMNSTEYFPAVLSGDIDAVVVTEPQLTSALNEYNMYMVCDATDYKTIINVILARDGFLEQYPDVSARMLKVFEEANVWVQENREEAIEIVAESGEVSEETLGSIYDTTEFSTVFSDEQTDSLMKTVEFLYSQGVLLETPTIDELFDDSYLKAAGIM